jgi:DNA-binding PadR family transcriptional regulator
MENRQQWLLMFLASPGGQYYTDQIRIMKGMFLLSQEGPGELQGLYRFTPYHYGPFNTSVYHDLDALEVAGLVRHDLVEGGNRRRYDLTDKGRHAVSGIAGLGKREVEAIRAVKRHVTSLSFLDLLKDVYRKYPDYAVNSVAKT